MLSLQENPLQPRMLKNSLSYISKIGLGVDFTARDIQKKNKKKGLPWSFAKCFDNSASISKLISINKFKDINNINFTLLKNKVKVQEGNSKLMIFNIEYLIHYISQKITLEKGEAKAEIEKPKHHAYEGSKNGQVNRIRKNLVFPKQAAFK